MKEIKQDDYHGSRMLPHTALEYAIEAGEQVQSIVFNKGEVIVMGIPAEREDYHNCDVMGCGQCHVLLRAKVDAFKVDTDVEAIVLKDGETFEVDEQGRPKPLVTVRDEPFDRAFADDLARMLKNPDCTCQSIGCPPAQCPTCVVLTG